MSKNEAPVELIPEAFIAETQGASKLPKRASRAAKAALPLAAGVAPGPAPWKAPDAKSPVKPILMGVGIAAAVAVAALALSSNKSARRGSVSSPRSTVGKMLAKAALVAVGRIVAKRAARALAQQAVRAVAARAATGVANRLIGQTPGETR